MDDAEYGPGITQPGNPEAMLKYASLDINFGDLVAADPTLPVPQASLHNYPNPFNPSTEIIFQISDERQIDHAQIDIFNAKGQKVKELKADMSSRPIRQQPERGEISHSITWDGTDSANQPVASGLYLYRLMVSGTPVAQQKMMLLK
jgi:hypothetical protein